MNNESYTIILATIVAVSISRAASLEISDIAIFDHNYRHKTEKYPTKQILYSTKE